MFDKIIARLRAAEAIGIFGHENPDGDAMGSAYSLKLALLQMGKRAEVFLPAEPEAAAFSLVRGREIPGPALEECDLFVAVDCAEGSRMGEYSQVFGAKENTVAIDHHITHRPFAKETAVEDIASCCELMVRLYEDMGVSITEDMANNLYLGMVTDTGNFKYSSVTTDTMRCAATLMDCGADFAGIAKRIFDTKTIEYYGLMKTALERIELYAEGKIAVLYLSMEDFASAGLHESAASPIVTLPRTIEGVEVGVYIREREQGSYKVSLRSSDDIDVAKTASHFGGGGHVRASGYTVSHTTVSEVTEAVVAELKQQLTKETV